MNTQLLLERAVLGNMLTGNSEEINAVLTELTPAHFEDMRNRITFEIIQEMHEGARVVDFLSVDHELKVNGAALLKDIGAAGSFEEPYLADLLDQVTTWAHVRGYINTLKRNLYLRHIRKELLRLNPEASPEAVEGIMELIALRDSTEKSLVVTPKDILPGYIEDLKNKRCEGIDTGFRTFDRNTFSQAGDLIVVAARTNVGKTTYLTNVLVNMLRRDVPCLYAPTEMRPAQFIDRMGPLITDIQASKFRSREFNASDMAELEIMPDKLSAMPLTVLDKAGPSLAEVSAAVKSSGAKVLFLDYLGRCEMPRENSRPREIEKFVVGLKNLCVERGILCFLAVQLSRATDFNKDSAPRLADLADSSAIEKEADAVVFLWKNPKNTTPTGNTAKIDALLAKNRHGYLMEWEIDFNKWNMRMTEAGATEPRRGWHEPEEQTVF